MNLSLICLACLFAIVGSASGATPGKAPEPPAHPQVLLETSKGNIVLELYPDKAPKTVENFLQYVKSGFYNGTIFHRVIPDFMIQGGGFTPEMTQKPTKGPVKNEADNRLPNERGTIAMARTGDPDSATAQFFINHKNNAALNFTSKSSSGWGYTVFGKVVEGMDVVDAIAQVPTGRKGMYENVPSQAVVIKKATVVHHASK
ncbi:MAG: peptidyl-prolyl cis-trans isomerase [Acidobacteriota bacterium]|jgi:cyclophilin family peptidyl-prolyl cis-trans isomerase|nr:peptidyl-prolyl cis-trans isomerase [Acidobacteriota bacterium]